MQRGITVFMLSNPFPCLKLEQIVLQEDLANKLIVFETEVAFHYTVMGPSLRIFCKLFPVLNWLIPGRFDSRVKPYNLISEVMPRIQ